MADYDTSDKCQVLDMFRPLHNEFNANGLPTDHLYSVYWSINDYNEMIAFAGRDFERDRCTMASTLRTCIKSLANSSQVSIDTRNMKPHVVDYIRRAISKYDARKGVVDVQSCFDDIEWL